MPTAPYPPESPLPTLPAWQNPAWLDVPGLSHGFFGRAGGSSAGELASLNLGARCGDDPDAVASNWTRVLEHLGLARVERMNQVHGAAVARLTTSDSTAPDVDGLTTDLSGTGLAVLTADCVPILMLARGTRAVAAVHAGWRGTLAGIAAVAVGEMRDGWNVPAESIEVALGPSIGACCYEVEAELGGRFEETWGSLAQAWQPHGSHGHLDLRAVNRLVFERSGVPASNIVEIGPCTACSHRQLFSHRASGGRAGRQAGVIGWKF